MSQTAAVTSPGLLLHAAIAQNDFAECQRLLTRHGARAAAVKNRNGTTPLMLAADGKCGRDNPRLIEALLADGAGGGATAAERNKKGRTAADIAGARGAAALGRRLRALEGEAAAREGFRRCALCRAKLRRRSKLEFVGDKVARGEETNRLVREFFRDEAAATSLARPAFHRINSCVSFRKELSESMALISQLKRLRTARSSGVCQEVNDSTGGAGQSWHNWHIVDLCCGNSLTAALALHLLPGVHVTAVDMAAPNNQPHFEAAGFVPPHFAYLQADVTRTAELAAALRRRGSDVATASRAGPARVVTVVFGMHCCGDLSRRAIDVARALRAEVALLMPCCLPSRARSDAATVAAVFGTQDTQDTQEQYGRWAQLLQDALKEGHGAAAEEGEGAETSLEQITDVLSPKNTLITYVRWAGTT